MFQPLRLHFGVKVFVTRVRVTCVNQDPSEVTGSRHIKWTDRDGCGLCGLCDDLVGPTVLPVRGSCEGRGVG